MSELGLYIAPSTLETHIHLFSKAVIVSISWGCGYAAMKHLPISIASPLGAIAPVWTLVGALIIFHEDLTIMQYVGFGMLLVSYWWLSSVGGKEGVRFYGNKWILFMIAATVFAAVSGLYDKYMIRNLGYSPLVVQAWFLIYLVPVLGLLMGFLRLIGQTEQCRFIWRWSIPVIALMLILGDILYFRAISYSGSLISVISSVRGSCVLVSFLVGGLLFCELQLKSKAMAVGGILAGTCFMFLPI
jgi:transporter family protein